MHFMLSAKVCTFLKKIFVSHKGKFAVVSIVKLGCIVTNSSKIGDIFSPTQAGTSGGRFGGRWV